ncbi:conjugal transfer protein TraB [Salmonella enterica subsp. enterica serovar Enteritidis]|nr:conjugal transfer protein TraB [Salmonella enterica subsp. enterica serovar Enteritidis]
MKFGGEIKPVNKDIVDGLMKIYPDPVLNPGAREELNAASDIWLTKAQYQYLLRMENTLQPESRISLLLELVSNAEHHGFMEHLVNIP